MLIKIKVLYCGMRFNRRLYKPSMETMCTGLNCKIHSVYIDGKCSICRIINDRCAIWKSSLIEQYVYIPL